MLALIYESNGENMNDVNKTLYIPLYGKSYVSKKGLFLADKKAEEIWEAEGFLLKGKAKSKWLAYYMGIRAAVFDDWLKQQIIDSPEAVILHIGCGMDSRAVRVDAKNHRWYDVDFATVIEERKRYYSETLNYKMIAADVRDTDWLNNITERKSAIIIMEGVGMYLNTDDMQSLMQALSEYFEAFTMLADFYTSFAVKMSKYKNPINEVGSIKVYGIDDPYALQNEKVAYSSEHIMTPQKYIDELRGMARFVFSKLYAGSVSKKLYRLFEYKNG